MTIQHQRDAVERVDVVAQQWRVYLAERAVRDAQKRHRASDRLFRDWVREKALLAAMEARLHG